MEEHIRHYDSFDLDDNGNLTLKYKIEVMGLGNINEGLMPPSKIRKFGVDRLRLMGSRNITDDDIHFYRRRYKNTREKKWLQIKCMRK